MAMELATYFVFAAIILIFIGKYIVFVSIAYLLLFILAMILASLLGIMLYLFLHSLCFHFGDQDDDI